MLPVPRRQHLLADTLPEYCDGGLGRVDAGMDAGAYPDGGILHMRGENELYVALAMTPADDPGARTEVHAFRSREPRYPARGIMWPVDGVVTASPEQFIDRCGPRDAGVDRGSPDGRS